MDAFGLAFWVTLVLVAVALVIHFHFRKKNRLKAEYDVLNSFAMELNTTISIHDSWDKIHIGMDNGTSPRLFFIRRSAENETRETIDLAGVRKCQLNTQVKTGVIEKIELVLSLHDKGKSERRLEIYNNDYDALTLTGELQLAMKWEEIVNKAISQTRKKEPAGVIQARRTA
jgi:hypothetical protein